MSEVSGVDQEQSQGERFGFEAEVDRLLELVVNSLYSNREVFLRELVSNASDAIDKLRFRSLTEPELGDAPPPRIRLRPDAESRTLTIEDTGVGMTRAELIEQLGTIAHSGTRRFLEAARQQQQAAPGADTQLIGQFGVGFYSAFLVADRVTVVSRAAGSDEAWSWSSDARAGFEVAPAEKSEWGTAVVLHLREEQSRFTEEWTLRSLVKRYSDFVQHPIELVQPPAADGDAEGDDAAETPAGERIEQLNRGRALWLKPKAEVTEEEYAEFYRHITHDWEPPLAHTHFSAEGMHQFRGLLYLPTRPPFDLFMPDQRRGVRLHVQRVFVMDECDELVPQWLRFVRGVIDSEDLPLNVSRELLQDSAATRAIRKQVIRKSVDVMETLSTERAEDYAKFWQEFGAVLKEGLHEAGDVGERLRGLVRYRSSHTGEDGWTSLAEYVERMGEEQKSIYYIVGRSVQAVEKSPHLEALRARGFEVLYFVDVVDEWAAQALREFDGKTLVNALQADLEIEAEEGEVKPSAEEQAREHGGLIERFKGVLGGRVADVRVSRRLHESPVCLVVPEGGLTAQMEQLLRAHGRDTPDTKRILEVNPKHALLKHVDGLLKQGAQDATIEDWVEVLFAQALLTEGSPVPDPNGFATRMTRLLGAAVPPAE